MRQPAAVAGVFSHSRVLEAAVESGLPAKTHSKATDFVRIVIMRLLVEEALDYEPGLVPNDGS